MVNLIFPPVNRIFNRQQTIHRSRYQICLCLPKSVISFFILTRVKKQHQHMAPVSEWYTSLLRNSLSSWLSSQTVISNGASPRSSYLVQVTHLTSSLSFRGVFYKYSSALPFSSLSAFTHSQVFLSPQELICSAALQIRANSPPSTTTTSRFRRWLPSPRFPKYAAYSFLHLLLFLSFSLGS